MGKSLGAERTADRAQQRLASYACDLDFEHLTPDAIHAAKVRLIDTLGVVIAGFFGEPCSIAREFVATRIDPNGATVLGTRIKATVDMAAFANATAARYTGMADSYHWPGSPHGHPSDTVMALLAVAEHLHASGRELITSIVLAYEVFLRICDGFRGEGFYNTNFACIGIAAACGKLFELSPGQLTHCIALAAVPNNMLKQVIMGRKSMFRAGASGWSAHAGVFAALLARAGMEGPAQPFEGKGGWSANVARSDFSLDTMGGTDVPFKILNTQIKDKASDGDLTACVLAAEKLAPLRAADVKQVVVEVYQYAKERTATDAAAWNPQSREAADHSAPYVVATVLMEGKIALRSYSAAELRNPARHAFMKKVEVIENPEFTRAFEKIPVEHRARITVIMNDGERLVSEAGGGHDDLAAPKSDAQIEKKFRELTEDVMSAQRSAAIVERLWRLEDISDIADIPPAFTLD